MNETSPDDTIYKTKQAKNKNMCLCRLEYRASVTPPAATQWLTTQCCQIGWFSAQLGNF